MTYRIVRVPMTDRPGKFVMEGGRYIGELVPVEPDEIKAADAFNAEMVRITGKSSAVEMRAIHAALRAGVGEQT